jgi:hypothetical protein
MLEKKNGTELIRLSQNNSRRVLKVCSQGLYLDISSEMRKEDPWDYGLT